jgi:uncharacterized caspase-like protein
MSRFVSSWVAALCSAILIALLPSGACAEQRVALVVGNAQYKNPNLVLYNPKNDAEDVAGVLRSLGFEVILRVDAGKRDFDLAMTQFARLATDADAALFYFAGHALQYQGRNYLMPTDAELEDDISLRYQMMMLDDVRAALERTVGVKIMILDACRNNPVVDRLKRRMVGVTRGFDLVRGLARIDKAQGIVVAYATAADEVAADGAGRNSPFTAALLKRLLEPGLEIGTMFRRIAADVNEQTKGHQRPEIYTSLINEFYLNYKDRPVWEQIKDSADPAAFRDFVNRFPASPRASDAEYRLQMLERQARERQLEQERAQSEAARAKRRLEEEQRAKSTATEGQLARQSVQPSPDEDARAKAEAPQQKQSRLTLTPSPIVPPADVQPAPLTREQTCKRDEEKLARLRASPVRDEVIRFERELGCERLRPQVLRLRESISGEEAHGERGDDQRVRAEQQRPQPDAQSQRPERDAAVKLPPSMSQDQICKRDQERLARLRASQVRDEVVRFERELGCERLRPQVLRLRESLAN